MLQSRIQWRFFSMLEGVRYGRLDLITPDGKLHQFSGTEKGLHANLRILDWRCLWGVVLRGDLGLGDAWVKGFWDTDDLQTCLEFLAVNFKSKRINDGYRFALSLTRLRYFLQRNTLGGSRRNVSKHYELGSNFYKIWLDRTMNYSSGLFSKASTDLESAQEDKLSRITDCLDKQSSILDIGCGWGGFIQHAIERGHDAKGITISPAHESWVREKMKDLGNNGKNIVSLQDYRKVKGKFDAVVSIEMYEHVGEEYWNNYFSKISELLKKNGTAVIQAINLKNKDLVSYRKSTDFIRSYIFPGIMLASKERLRTEADRAGLRVVDVFSFGKSYTRTLEIWLSNFESSWDHQIKPLGFDERFARIWRYYLAYCRAAFASGILDVSQLQLKHAR